MGEILEERFRFIQDDVFLIAHVNVKTGKQKLIMQKIDSKSGKVEFSDFIECIHTAITDISVEEFDNWQNYDIEQEDFYRKMLNIRSSENLIEIHLAPEEKFKALKSWVAGIAEAGKEAFKLESDIELAGHLMYPISGKLLQFMIKIESDFIFEYLDKIGRECRFEGVRHEPSLIANLIPIFEMLYEDFMHPSIKNREEILKTIYDFEFSLDVISRGANFMKILLNEHPEITVQHLIDTIERECIKKGPYHKIEILQKIGPICIAFIEARNREFTDYDKEFIKTVLDLNPPKRWLQKIGFLPHLKKANLF